MRSFLSIVAAPLLCVSVLGGVVWERGRHATPQDAAPFHAAAKRAINGWPTRIGDWFGADRELPPAAVQLLNPNALLCRQYTNPREPGRAPVQLLIVQCSKPEDMSGHYPPVCYPNNGNPKLSERSRTWTIPGRKNPIRGMEYVFDQGFDPGIISSGSQIVVYNFFVLPGRGIVPDMAPVREATGDYQRKHYGAAQIQVKFQESKDAAGSDPAWRDRVFVEIIGACPDVLEQLAPKI